MSLRAAADGFVGEISMPGFTFLNDSIGSPTSPACAGGREMALAVEGTVCQILIPFKENTAEMSDHSAVYFNDIGNC